MAETASDILMDILIDWNVKVIFGLPGDGINDLMEGAPQTERQNSFHSSAA